MIKPKIGRYASRLIAFCAMALAVETSCCAVCIRLEASSAWLMSAAIENRSEVVPSAAAVATGLGHRLDVAGRADTAEVKFARLACLSGAAMVKCDAMLVWIDIILCLSPSVLSSLRVSY